MKPTFLLVTCDVKKNKDVAKQIQKNQGVKEALPVFGTYDCIVKTDDMAENEVKEFVLSSIRPLDGVSAVLPLYTTPPKIWQNSDE